MGLFNFQESIPHDLCLNNSDVGLIAVPVNFEGREST
jgi:hypothetical protein